MWLAFWSHSEGSTIHTTTEVNVLPSPCSQEGIAPLVTVVNDDPPEALLDGLLQATVCTDLIGWREESRKLILAFTDQHFHVAGDGRVML